MSDRSTESVHRVGTPSRSTGPTNERTNELTQNRPTERTSGTFRNARTHMRRFISWTSA